MKPVRFDSGVRYDDPNLRKVLCGPYHVHASGPRIVENFLDMAHFAYVHTGILGEPARPHISTRLILVRYGEHLLGLIAEQATEMMQREAGSFADTGIASDAAPYLGPGTQDGGRLVRWIDVQKLLPAAVSGVLFRQAEGDAWSTPESPRC